MMHRHHTVSAEKRSLTLKLFMAQFVNTALSSLVANMYIPALYKRLQDTFLGTLIFQVPFHNQHHVVLPRLAMTLFSLVANMYIAALYKRLQDTFHLPGGILTIMRTCWKQPFLGADMHILALYKHLQGTILGTLIFQVALPQSRIMLKTILSNLIASMHIPALYKRL